MPKITIVAVSHNEIACPFVFSLMKQTSIDWNAIVWNNGPWENNENIISVDSGDDRIIHKRSATDTGNWGTANRQQAIDECTTEYIIQTSVQDYWMPQAVEYILKGLEQSPDILLWDSINHIVGPCQVMDCQLQLGKVDWGNFAIRTDIAKKVGIRHGSRYTADWLFLNDCINMGLLNKVHKLPLVLTVHN